MPSDQANEREDDIPFEEQLRALDNVVRAGKVCPTRTYSCLCNPFLGSVSSTHVSAELAAQSLCYGSFFLV
jgi:hypothetical protein